ncbi:MAG: DUF1638 domain-containing protein [Actinobacteria bacterium]|nr:DUF1638 domain-containing protein [Actinomycetota bacterium]
MSSIVLACRTIEDEVAKAVEETGVDYPVKWVESGLHNFPDRLRNTLQREIDDISNVDTIILCYGYCGNSLLGLKSASARLVVPRVDDCISLLLGSYRKRMELSRETGTYFLTRGWLVNENNIVVEYQRCLERFGEERARKVFRTLLNHYRRLALIDTGTYPLDDERIRRSCGIMQELGLMPCVVQGSTEYLRRLLTGPWNEDFVVLEPGGTLTFEDFMLDVSESISGLSLFGFGKGGAK